MTFEVQPIASSIISSLDYSFGSFFSLSSPRMFKIAGFFGGFYLRRSPTMFSPSFVLNSSSTFKNDYLSHSCSPLVFIVSFVFSKIPSYFILQKTATSRPPCPSKTPNRALSSEPRNLDLAI